MNTAKRCDIAIVGAGIVGLAHALAAVKRGHTVTVFERDSQPLGASVRNFGLGLVLGQAQGEMHALARTSREIWLDVLPKAGCWHKTQGSVTVARNAVEQAVLDEFQALRGHEYGTRLLSPAEVGTFGLPIGQVTGGLYSGDEIAFESRVALPRIVAWLAEVHGVEFVFGAQVNAIDLPTVTTSRGVWQAERAIVCAGHDFQTLFPDAYAQPPLQRCALQMLRVANPGVMLGPAFMTGMSTLRYSSFAGLETLAALRRQLDESDPVWLNEGIHLIVQQVGASGELLIGDSHRYGESVGPFNSEAIDARLLQLAGSLLGRPLTVLERWQGVYASGPDGYLVREPAPGVTAVAITCGIGMSVSFGLAEQILGPA
ncbi:TIGR03364 family FAD-dependent oxidoreductase [Jeongeupia naejangsanensis]|uniref:TIGR03364 family FAD-dependent oxidoreductase n=1 Tax=Jeongeupia naejangsanensis TaxID=613195 RepID=A0ABS2BIG9_9NEIS|nr:TIGR03364 family FAD-dependent oxidoreductase [Jeongeupia naejangsanensis]MBM3115408.1 TIGR03364 family FAD-dependent oxidoreductase [Jeongeupia naejangsanensis]